MKDLKAADLRVEVAFYEDIPVNTGKTVRYRGQEIALFRLQDGRILAIENRCPHKNGVLAEGMVSGEYVFCPLHDRKIDLTSGLFKPRIPDALKHSTFQWKTGWSTFNFQLLLAMRGDFR
jgi:nitrite reductase (NADH) small subunit